MVFYKHRSKFSLKWVVALILFILAMTITTAEVYGIHIQPSQVSDYQSDVIITDIVKNNVNNDLAMSTLQASNSNLTVDRCPYNEPLRESDDNPLSVPEPGTLILLGSGLAIIYGYARKKNI